MYDPRSLAPETLIWALDQASNELNAYLCEADPWKELGENWPATARETAVQCRAVAAAATQETERKSWLALAKSYDDAAQPAA